MTDEEKVREALPETVAALDELREFLDRGDGRLEMDKLAEVGASFRAVVDFQQWARGVGLTWAIPVDKVGWTPLHMTSDALAAQWLGIDLAKVEEERAAFLAEHTDDTGATP